MATAFSLARKPLSRNAKHAQGYLNAITLAAQNRHQGPLLVAPLYSRILWFHKQPSSQGDIDNMAKGIHDALKQVIFDDDRWITHTLAIRVDLSVQVDVLADPDNPEAFAELTELLGNPDVPHVLYVEIGSQPQRNIQLGAVTP
jgi:Holliday junction resolvase RusA-like endonuclease